VDEGAGGQATATAGARGPCRPALAYEGADDRDLVKETRLARAFSQEAGVTLFGSIDLPLSEQLDLS
jgi:hypothetical protein